MLWLKGTISGRAVFVRQEDLSRGRSLFVAKTGNAWGAYSARDWLDAPGTDATADENAWCDKVVFVSSNGGGSAYFDVR